MKKEDVVFFFGAKNANGEFSNHFMCEFEVFGHTYNCVEQYMMSQKALISRDYEMFNKILNSKNPVEMKHLGREVRDFDKRKWEEVKMKIVKRAVRAKFEQNWDLREMLLSTGDKMLVESNPKDRVWGIGYCKSSDNVFEEVENWGKNLLGKILMEVRDELRGIEFDDRFEEVNVIEEERKECEVEELRDVNEVKVVRDVESVDNGKVKVRRTKIGNGKVCELSCEVWKDKNFGKKDAEEKWELEKVVKVGVFENGVEARKFARKNKMNGMRKNGVKLSWRTKVMSMR